MNDFGLLVGRYFSTLPTLNDTQLSELQLDASGRLIIAGRYLVDTTAQASDPALLMLGQRKDANTTIASADGKYAPFQLDAEGRLKVATVVSVEPSDAEFVEGDPHGNTDVGLHMLTVRQDSLIALTNDDGDYSSIKVTAKGEVYTHDADALAQLVSANSTLTNIKSDTASIVTNTANIHTDLTTLTKLEDAPAVSGSAGIQVFVQRHDADTSTVDTDGDLSLMHVDQFGRLKTVSKLDASGTAGYTVTDDLTAGEDGLLTITAAATPWITVASFPLTSGTAYVYGWQWACDQNAQARLVTDDTTDLIVYKNSINSSSEPERSEHWSESGRIEIAGAASLEIKLQIKKRSAAGGNANGGGSIHLRTV